MAQDIVADLRTHRQGRTHMQIEINASYLIDAEDEIVALRARVKIRDQEVARLRGELAELNNVLSRSE